MTYLTLAVSRDARVITNVLVLNRRDPQLGAFVKDTNRVGCSYGIGILVPNYFGGRCTLRLAVEDYRITQIHVDHVLGSYTKFWWRYKTYRAKLTARDYSSEIYVWLGHGRK